MNFKDFDFMGLLILLTIFFGIFCLVYPRIIVKKSAQKIGDRNTFIKIDDISKKWTNASKIFLIAGITAIMLSFGYLFNDQPISTSGRWAWLIYFIYSIGGNFGLFLTFFLSGLAIVISVFFSNK